MSDKKYSLHEIEKLIIPNTPDVKTDIKIFNQYIKGKKNITLTVICESNEQALSDIMHAAHTLGDYMDLGKDELVSLFREAY